MGKRIVISATSYMGSLRAALFLICWCIKHPGAGLGGATGRSPVLMWEIVHRCLIGAAAEVLNAVYGQKVYFLDEYFGPYAAYYHWAWRNLCTQNEREPRFQPNQIFVPRGAFFDPSTLQPITSARLEAILAENKGEWVGSTMPGEGRQLPEIRILETAKHPVLVEIRDAMIAYDLLVQAEGKKRLQILGIGPGGLVALILLAGGHLGFVEAGAAAYGTKTMLVRLAKSTNDANAPDFRLWNDDGDVKLEPAVHAVTQGIATILSAAELLVLAWGKKKAEPVKRMLIGEPNPLNPAGWVQNHPNVTVFVDLAAFSDLNKDELKKLGWEVEFPDLE